MYMMKYRLFFLSLFAICFSLSTHAQNNFPVSTDGDQNPRKILVEKGKTLSDFVNLRELRSQQDDINPGQDPEGDFMLNSAFSTDGTRLFVVTGGTNNVTVFDFETMTPLAMISGLDAYPVDIAVTDTYAVITGLESAVYVVNLSDYTIAETFNFSDEAQAVSVVTSSDGQYAYVALDVSDQLVKINLQTLQIDLTIDNFPVELLSYSMITTGGRWSFDFSKFLISSDGSEIIVGNDDHSVLFYNTSTGAIDYTLDNISSCRTIGLSGDGLRSIALSYDWDLSQLKVFQIDNATHAITATVEVPGYTIMTEGIAVNQDGSKAYIGVSNNSSALIRFETADFLTFSQNYTPFWIGTSADHQYAVHGQNRFSIFDFETENFADHFWGNAQSFGAVSPLGFKVAGYSPLRYEGVYFYDCENPQDITYKGKNLVGMPLEGDTPYRIAVSPDGTKAISVNNVSENISIMDITNNSVDTIVDMGENCWEVTFTHDSKWAILGGYDSNSIKIIDMTTEAFVTSVYTGQRPMMLQVSPDDSFVYVGNLKGNSVSIVQLDGSNSQTLTTIPTGTIGISYAAYGVKSGVQLDPTGQYLLVAASFDDQVQVIDVAQQQIVANLNVGTFPLQIAFNSAGDYAAVTNLNSGNFSLIHVDGAASSVVGTYASGGDMPLRIAFNPSANEFSILNYNSKNIANVNAETGAINSVDYYSSFGNPEQILFDEDGIPLVLVASDGNTSSYLVKNKTEAIELPAVPTFFSYCPAIQSAAVCMPGPDHISVIDYRITPIIAQDIKGVFDLNIYPNPFTDRLNISFAQQPKNKISIHIYNLEGRSLLFKETTTKETKIDLTDFHSGIYLLKMSDGEKSWSTRIEKLNK